MEYVIEKESLIANYEEHTHQKTKVRDIKTRAHLFCADNFDSQQVMYLPHHLSPFSSSLNARNITEVALFADDGCAGQNKKVDSTSYAYVCGTEFAKPISMKPATARVKATP